MSTGAGGDFYLMDPTGESPVKLGEGVDPSISRDGTKIAYARNDGPTPSLYTMDVTGTGVSLVYQGAFQNQDVLENQ